MSLSHLGDNGARAISIAALYIFTVGGALFGAWSVARIALIPA